MTTVLYTLLALFAFAANSVLARLAMGSGAIDANSFTIVRLISGAMALWLLTYFTRGVSQRAGTEHGAEKEYQQVAPLMLFIYAAAFSFAYTRLDTGVGALVLFGVVQLTMVLTGVWRGDRPGLLKLCGLTLAFAGLSYLLWPEATDPLTENQSSVSYFGFLLMAVSGAAWGIYTLLGQNTNNPLQATATNFIKALPYTLVLLGFFFIQPAVLSTQGILLAITAGALTSGVGYAIWYRALSHLSTLRAAVVQLLVPLIATLGGILFVGEALTPKLLISLCVVLIGIFVVIYQPAKGH